MNVLIIFAHPNEESFCAALREKIVQGLNQSINNIRIHNLYQDDFNPILSKKELKSKGIIKTDELAKKYQEDIEWANHLIIIHPAYWYGVPAILKGYFDRLLTEGFSYDYKIDHPEPRFQNKTGTLIQTFDAEEQMEKELFDDITKKSVLYTWKYCGIDNWTFLRLFRVNFSSKEQRNDWLKEAYNLGVNIGSKFE